MAKLVSNSRKSRCQIGVALELEVPAARFIREEHDAWITAKPTLKADSVDHELFLTRPLFHCGPRNTRAGKSAGILAIGQDQHHSTSLLIGQGGHRYIDGLPHR